MNAPLRPSHSSETPRYLLRVAFGSSVLLDTREADDVFRAQGEAAYVQHMEQTEDKPFAPGALYPLARLLLHINKLSGMRVFDLVLVSMNHGAAAIKVEKSLMQLGFYENGQFAFHHKTYNRGHEDDLLEDLSRLRADVYFSSHAELVTKALDRGIPAAHFAANGISEQELQTTQKILKTKSLNTLFELSQKAFQIFVDFDGVLADRQSENFFQTALRRFGPTDGRAVTSYNAHEKALENSPVPYGPLAPFILGLSHFVDIRLLTARSGNALHRAIKTLRGWGLNNLSTISLPTYQSIDLAKAEMMASPRGKSQTTRVPLLFVDDSASHIHAARAANISATGHVRVPQSLSTWACHTNSFERVQTFIKTLRSKGLAFSRTHLATTFPEPL